MKFSLIIFLGIAIFAAVKTSITPVEQTQGVTTVTANTNNTANPRTKHFRLTKDGLAIDGYDPVSYFKSGPKKGKATFSYNYDGIVYHFANAENLTEFKGNPGKYEPVWGGWCGHAMAVRGEKVEINPECYKIVDGRNVLFFKTFYANALTNWEKEIKKTPEKTLMKQGDDFWTKTLEQ
ncbi:MAG: YHS domain protein [Lewinellaceae bacterium]|nr:YHS domain protein [Lewinellaceae bacterium]